MADSAPRWPITAEVTPSVLQALADHGLEPNEHKGLHYPLGDHAPEYGRLFPLLPDIGWTRLPVPGSLNHINIWLLADRDEEGDGIAIVDTGLHMPASREAWETLLAGDLKGKRITRVICTHFHPDHVGCAGWLCKTQGVRLWMNRTEWLMARMLTADIREGPPEEAITQMRFAGWDEERLEKMRQRGWGNFAKAVSPLPVTHVRLEDEQVITVGGRNWRILTGGGHTPEHCCLVDEDNGVVIAGDQILPRITSNVSISLSEPMADPLGEWLESIAKFRARLSKDMLVLPAHGFPFTGVFERLDALAGGHHNQLEALEAAIAKKPMRAVDTFGLLFARKIDNSVYGLATGEAMAHLRHLEVTGRACCETRDGVGWFSAS
ncbi:MAG: MBL fold metallo-hydrolase [Pseudomonadota bacterium]